MDDALVDRVEALERAVTDGDHDLSALATDAEALDRLDRVETRCEELEARVAELEAATQALRGYVGNVRAVNEEVETRAETALSKAQSLEEQLATRNDSQPTHTPGDRARADPPSDRGQPETSQPLSESPTQRHHPATDQADTGHQRCQECGHRPESGTTGGPDEWRHESETSDEWADDDIADDDPLVSEESSGTLERFRQLL